MFTGILPLAHLCNIIGLCNNDFIDCAMILNNVIIMMMMAMTLKESCELGGGGATWMLCWCSWKLGFGSTPANYQTHLNLHHHHSHHHFITSLQSSSSQAKSHIYHTYIIGWAIPEFSNWMNILLKWIQPNSILPTFLNWIIVWIENWSAIIESDNELNQFLPKFETLNRIVLGIAQGYLIITINITIITIIIIFLCRQMITALLCYFRFTAWLTCYYFYVLLKLFSSKIAFVLQYKIIIFSTAQK